MLPTRRAVVAGLAALLAAPVPALAADDFPIMPDAGFDRWLARFRPRAEKRGIKAATLDRAFAGAGFIPAVIEKDRGQFEFHLGLQDYLAITVSEERVRKGRAALARQGGLLRQIEAAYGVEAHVLAAVWGIESFYGAKRGTVNTIAALATLAYEGRRAEFFEEQLIAALKILQRGDVTPERMLGGWAGAMGHTQFIPTTYAAFAVDFRGDGRRDVWGDDPTDALASAANYLAESGWSHGRPWGAEVRVPRGLKAGGRRASAEWSEAGVTLAGGGRLPDHGRASLVQPESPGPAFILWANAGVMARYNGAQKYVIALGHLSDRIKGAGPLVTGFPPDEFGLTQADRVELQKRLTRLGYDCGSVDGVFGPMTRAAIRGFQKSRGMAVDGVPSRALLEALR